VGERPDCHYNMRPFRLITDYIFTQLDTYGYIIVVPAGSFRFCIM